MPSHNIVMLHSGIMNSDLGNYIYNSLWDLANPLTEQALSSPYSSLHLRNGLETQFKLMAVCVLQYESVYTIILYLVQSLIVFSYTCVYVTFGTLT